LIAAEFFAADGFDRDNSKSCTFVGFPEDALYMPSLDAIASQRTVFRGVSLPVVGKDDLELSVGSAQAAKTLERCTFGTRHRPQEASPGQNHGQSIGDSWQFDGERVHGFRNAKKIRHAST
jgi:hypothetical protein